MILPSATDILDWSEWNTNARWNRRPLHAREANIQTDRQADRLPVTGENQRGRRDNRDYRRRLVINIGGQKFGSKILGGQKFGLQILGGKRIYFQTKNLEKVPFYSLQNF